jgi:hypothetical protein
MKFQSNQFWVRGVRYAVCGKSEPRAASRKPQTADQNFHFFERFFIIFIFIFTFAPAVNSI